MSERLTAAEAGVASICTAHPMVIEAALSSALRTGKRVLIEATCNQVNQEGGYTGMTPADFRQFVEGIAARVGLTRPSDSWRRPSRSQPLEASGRRTRRWDGRKR